MGEMDRFRRPQNDFLPARLFIVVGQFVICFAAINFSHAEETERNAFSASSIHFKSHWKRSWSSADQPQQINRLDGQIRRASGDGEEKNRQNEIRSDSDRQPLRADAGDDVLSFVGRRATLNGGQSLPAGQVGVRWIQISGPMVKEAYLQGPNLVVIPPEAGVYQFLLVVAMGNQISEPDHVTLTAVEIPAELKQKSPVANENTPNQPAKPTEEPAAQPVSNEELMSRLAFQSIRNLPGSAEMAQPLAQLFSDVASKMSLYASYSEANEELSRRIGLLINDTRADSQAWTTHIFEPLTAALALWTQTSGLNLRDRKQWQQPLSQVQRDSIRDGLMAFARGLRGDMKTGFRTNQSGAETSQVAAQGTALESKK
jgi:hypothetical protein